ncbi:MAG: lipid-A-disaccharide synthase N-terminal domain-containing protein [Elusimicrobia bacterium]|nr:lipid-A-disaccharide synthase N-terminal domain-containing protein [Elusimicrobiota bacterium]
MQWIGYVGVVAFALAWVPQSLETIAAGVCEVNPVFLALSALGSFALALYAFLSRDAVFAILNTLTTVGALVNVCYRIFPRAAGTPAAAGSALEPAVADDGRQQP